MRRSRLARLASAAVFGTLLLPFNPAPTVFSDSSAQSPSDFTNEASTSDGERLVVGLEAFDDAEELVDVIELATGSSASIVSVLSDGVVVQLAQPAGRAELRAAIVGAETLDGIEFAEPDSRRWTTDAPDDPQYPSQWSLSSTFGPDPASGIGVEGAWSVTPGSDDIVVAVIDSGILPHPDISARLITGADLINDPTFSNDGDGRDSDNTDEGDSCEGRPSSWHGLHVAGTIGASTNNGTGVAGIDQRARVQPVRALGTCGGYSSDIADAYSASTTVTAAALHPSKGGVSSSSTGTRTSRAAVATAASTDAPAGPWAR